MSDPLQNISINQLRHHLHGGSNDASLGNDFFLKEIRYDNSMQQLRHPFRFDGYIGLFCLSGSFTVEINMKRYKIQPNNFMVCVPGYIMHICDIDTTPSEDLHFIIVAMSKDYMPAIRLDVNRLFNEGMTVLETPVVSLNEKEYALCKKYMDLALDVLSSTLSDKKGVLSHLIASVMHLFSQIWDRHIESARSTGTAATPRNKMIFEQFLKLVAEYHTTYRNMAFYAERMCLTPKYLSKLIKQASGRSAPEWIDSFVILEAKNLLKYSDTTIKEIVYRLHFPNQSVFYKFFKAHTGMTPSEYRNS